MKAGNDSIPTPRRRKISPKVIAVVGKIPHLTAVHHSESLSPDGCASRSGCTSLHFPTALYSCGACGRVGEAGVGHALPWLSADKSKLGSDWNQARRFPPTRLLSRFGEQWSLLSTLSS